MIGGVSQFEASVTYFVDDPRATMSMLTYSAIVGYWIWFHGRIQDKLEFFYSLVHDAIAGNSCWDFEVTSVLLEVITTAVRVLR